MTLERIDGSSNIHSAGYDEESQVMHVKFQSGATYALHDITPAKYRAFLDADSKGKHFHKHLKDRHTTFKL